MNMNDSRRKIWPLEESVLNLFRQFDRTNQPYLAIIGNSKKVECQYHACSFTGWELEELLYAFFTELIDRHDVDEAAVLEVLDSVVWRIHNWCSGDAECTSNSQEGKKIC